MSYRNTKTLTKPSTPAKWQIPMRKTLQAEWSFLLREN